MRGDGETEGTEGAGRGDGEKNKRVHTVNNAWRRRFV